MEDSLGDSFASGDSSGDLIQFNDPVQFNNMNDLIEILNESQVFSLLNCSECRAHQSEIEGLRRQVKHLTETVEAYRRFDPKPSASDFASQADPDAEDDLPLPPPPPIDDTWDIHDTPATSTSQGLNVFHHDPLTSTNVEPFRMVNGVDLSHVNIKSLDAEIRFKKLKNRHVAYYGMNPYSYGSMTHQTQPLRPNSYLLKVAQEVREHFPEIKFNSVLVTKFGSGYDNLVYHQDNEDSISDNSMILTLSLGDTRPINFRHIVNNGAELSIAPRHGEIYLMSKVSQRYFEHSVPKVPNGKQRISLTFRLIGEEHDQDFLTPVPSCAPLADQPRPLKPDYVSNKSSVASKQKPSSVYISSSMFRKLDAKKLSSDTQTAHVFSYPGATTCAMMERFKSDSCFKGIARDEITKVFLMCGTNDVDNLTRDRHSFKKRLEGLGVDVERFVDLLIELMPNAIVSIINILPRADYDRNNVINSINSTIMSICNNRDFLKFVSTETDRKLFTKRGYRNVIYFMAGSHRYPDNPHLNRVGIVRLANHLKYLAHA